MQTIRFQSASLWRHCLCKPWKYCSHKPKSDLTHLKMVFHSVTHSETYSHSLNLDAYRNPAVALAPFDRWTLRDEVSQSRSP